MNYGFIESAESDCYSLIQRIDHAISSLEVLNNRCDCGYTIDHPSVHGHTTSCIRNYISRILQDLTS